MKDLLEYITKNIVSNPDVVEIREERDNGMVNLSLTVAPEDMGVIIGKSGQTINSIRKLLTVRAISENIRVNLQLNESGKPGNQLKTEELEPVEKAENQPETEKTAANEINNTED